MNRKIVILTVLLGIGASAVFGQQSVYTAQYENFFASAQQYEATGQWFHALNAWYDCVNSPVDNADEARQRYQELLRRVESGDQQVWKNLQVDAERYWSTHFPASFVVTAQGIQKNDPKERTVEYVIEYERVWSDRYEEIMAAVEKGLPAGSRWPAWSVLGRETKVQEACVYNGVPSWFSKAAGACILQFSIIFEDGTVLFIGAPQVSGNRYVFSGLPVEFVTLLVNQKAYIAVTAIALRSGSDTQSSLYRISVDEQIAFVLPQRTRNDVLDVIETVQTVEKPTAESSFVAELPVTVQEPYAASVISETVLPVTAPVTPAAPVAAKPVEPVTESPVAQPATALKSAPEQEIPAVEQERSAEQVPVKPVTEPVTDENAVAVADAAAESADNTAEFIDEPVEIESFVQFYGGISHDKYIHAGFSTSRPIAGPVVFGIQGGSGYESQSAGSSAVLPIYMDVLFRLGVAKHLGRFVVLEGYGIVGFYDINILSIPATHGAPLTVGAGVRSDIIVRSWVFGVSAWGGYTFSGKISSSFTASIGKRVAL